MNAPSPTPAELLGPLDARREVRKAVILAAGRGRRMGKLTADRPKAALEVGGHALIDWQIAALRRAGATDIAVVTGHGAAALAGRDVTYIHNANWASGAQVESLLTAAPWIGVEPVIVSYGDILYHPSAALALLERPGDIVIAYDADHRWLWKRRFGNWLKDSETFRLAPGQVLAEIGGKPTDIEAVEGQFMGLMLFTPVGLRVIGGHLSAASAEVRKRTDFTRLMAGLVDHGVRIDTAANVLPWMEIDSPRDLRIARRMAARDGIDDDRPAVLVFPDSAPPERQTNILEGTNPSPVPEIGATGRVCGAFAIQNWGRSGSTLLQSLFDDHPQVLSTPNFYSRAFYIRWARQIAPAPDDEKVDAFLSGFRQWWDTGLVDASAGLHRLGPHRTKLAGVSRVELERHLRDALSPGTPITRKALFAAAHLAYARARGQILEGSDLRVLYPIHGQPRGVACAFLEDFPSARLIHTVREPVSNTAASLRHLIANNLHLENDPIEITLKTLFAGQTCSNRPHTLFSTRPYLDYVLAHDQARFVRFEDLHDCGERTLRKLCAWLGIPFHPCLLASTWDGAKWWNRPESGVDSVLGAKPRSNTEEWLSFADVKRVEALAAGLPGIATLYPRAPEARRRPSLSAIPWIWLVSWRAASVYRVSEFRGLRALCAVTRVLPRPAGSRLAFLVARELKRIRLLTLLHGATEIRQRLAEEHRCKDVDGRLVVSRTDEGWRYRFFTRDASMSTHGRSDTLTVVFGEGQVEAATGWGPVLRVAAGLIGAPMARCAAAVKNGALVLALVWSRASLHKHGSAPEG